MLPLLIDKAAHDVSGEARVPAGRPDGGRWTHEAIAAKLGWDDDDYKMAASLGAAGLKKIAATAGVSVADLKAAIAERGNGVADGGLPTGPALAALVHEAAVSIPDPFGNVASHGNHKVYVADLYDGLKDRLRGMTLDAFKAALMAAHVAGHVELGRSDMLPYTKNPAQGNRSEIVHPHSANATFHVVNVPVRKAAGWLPLLIEKAGSFTGTVFGRYYLSGQEVDAATYNAQKGRSVPREPKVPTQEWQNIRANKIKDAAHKFTRNVDHYHREVRGGKLTADQAADHLLAMHGAYEGALRPYVAQQFERIKRAIVDQYGDEEEVRSALRDFEAKFGKKLDEHIGAADERSVDLHHEGDEGAKRAERDRTRSAHYDTAHLLQVLTSDGYKIVSQWIEEDMAKRDGGKKSIRDTPLLVEKAHDVSGEKRDGAGQWTAGGATDSDSDAHARKLATRIREVPSAVRRKVGAFVRGRYDKLASRYGHTGAKAILGAAVLMTPLPLPGTTLIPVAFAEIVLHLRRAISKADTLGDEDIRREAKALLTALYEHMGEEPPKGA